jgi:alpha-N-arabinofuranosidase
MKPTLLLLTALLLTPLAALHAAETPTATPQAVVTINMDAPCVVYNRMVFGGFIEHFSKQIYGGIFEPGSSLADQKGFRLDVIEALKELKVPVIRWPGGCFVDSYHWMKGVGKDRQPYDDVRWGVIEPNTFGTDEFVELCRRLGAEPYICHNGLADVQEMANWVEYCNATKGTFADMRKANGHPEPHNVKIWSVGNEMGGKAYIDRVRDGARAMRKVDPTILVTCSGSHGPKAQVDPYLYETAGNDLNLLSIHEYWIANYQAYHETDYLGCMMLSEKPDAHITAIVKSLAVAGVQRRIKIAFDEWNLRSWHHPGFPRVDQINYNEDRIVAMIKARDKSLEPALYTMADALFCASFLNSCLRNADDVAMANIAPLVNDTGPLYVHPKGIVRRTHFHTLAMYANELEPRVGRLDIQADKLSQGTQSVSVADAIATVDESGKNWAIALVNRHPDTEVVCTVKMKDLLLDGEYAATGLSGDSPDSFNDIENPNRVIPRKKTLAFTKGVVRLPPHSLTIIKVPLN